MHPTKGTVSYTKRLFFCRSVFHQHIPKLSIRKNHNEIPFVNLYQKVTGETVQDNFILNIRKKYPAIIKVPEENLQCTIEVLKKFGITAEDACHDPHVFCMNPISMDNYGEILKECKFNFIITKYIIRYHTLVKSKTISWLKKEGILKDDLNLEETLYNYLNNFPESLISLKNFQETKTNIVTIRMSILEKYLQWKLNITTDEFEKYCKNYLPLRHRPLCDIQESLHIAENDIKFNTDVIRRNGFIISSDPTNTKLILKNVDCLGGLEIRDAIKLEPAILKNNYQSLLEIRSLLKEYNVSNEAQRRGLRVYCMRPATVRERLDHISTLKEYPVLSTNSRMLHMVVHEKKMMNRLNKIHAAKKQCYSLNHLVSSTKVFNTYINSFGEKVCGKDVGALIGATLQGRNITVPTVLSKLRRHKYWLHTALDVIGDNLTMLKEDFEDDVIFENCQIILYPVNEIKKYIKHLQDLRKGTSVIDTNLLEASYNNLNFIEINDTQLLSLVLYEIEKRYHFSGDGIWNRQDGGKTEQSSEKIVQNK